MQLRTRTANELHVSDPAQRVSVEKAGNSEPEAKHTKRSLAAEPIPLPVSGIILCGGKSRRMGREKAFLPYAGATLIENRLDRMQALFAEVFLVTSQPEQFSHISANVVKDIVPDKGPLAGVLSGLLVSVFEHCFVMPCDMPLLDDQILRAMAARRHGLDMLLYQHGDTVEPLVGIYSRRCAAALEQAVFKGATHQISLVEGLATDTFCAPRSGKAALLPPHFDINSAGDYARLLGRPAVRS